MTLRYVIVLAIYVRLGLCNEGTCDSKSEQCTEDKPVKRKVVSSRDWILIDPALNALEQDDPRLIKALQDRFLQPPSNKAYNFSSKTKVRMDGQHGQPIELNDRVFKGKKKGFFIEAGAYDGEKFSNSLFFEVVHKWSGLLVEPNPYVYQDLVKKNRKAWTFPNCFSTKTKPEIVKFDAMGLFGGIENGGVKPGDITTGGLKEEAITKDKSSPYYTPYPRKTLHLQCFPVYSVLLALGNPTVDYFSLDIEGAEIPVLLTIPWDKVDIKVLGVESNHFGEVFEETGKKLERLLRKAGYRFLGRFGLDNMYLKKDGNEEGDDD